MATKGKYGKEGGDAPIRTLADTHLWKQFAKLRQKHAGENREDVTLVIANKLTLGVEDAWYVWQALDPGLRDSSLRNPDLDDLTTWTTTSGPTPGPRAGSSTSSTRRRTCRRTRARSR